MKKLLLFISIVFTITFTSNSFSQNILIVFDSADSTSCDGAAAIDSNIVATNTVWYSGGLVIGAGYSWIDSLCPGTYVLTYNDFLGNPMSYTFVISVSSNPCGSFYATIATTDITDSINCNGTAVATTYGGAAPYSYLWNTGATTMSQSNLCEGMYSCIITDGNGCTSNQDGFVGVFPTIPDTVIIIVNTTYADSLVVDSLANYWLAMCNLDYAAFDSAYISFYTYSTMDTIWVTWTLIDTSGAEMVIVVVPYVLNNPTIGVYAATITLFCVQKASEINTIQITDQILLDPAQMGINENTSIELKVLNPFGDEVNVSFEKPSSGKATLSDMNGKVLIERVFENESVLQLNYQNVSAGTYFLTIKMNGEIITRKLIK